MIYLNKNWKEEYGGYLELWDKDMTKCIKKIAPTFNTMVIFSTTDFSNHGHPDPLNCPNERSENPLLYIIFHLVDQNMRLLISTKRIGHTSKIEKELRTMFTRKRKL